MKIKRLKQKLEEGMHVPNGAGIIVSQSTSSFQFVSEDRLHYLECAIDSRGCVADVGKDVAPQVFEVYCAPARNKIRKGIVDVVRQRLLSDLAAANALLAQLKKDDVVKDGSTISPAEIGDPEYSE